MWRQLLGVLVLVGVSLAQERPADCGECDPALCSAPENCLAGKTLDRCGCCEVCAKGEYELCDHPALNTPPGLYGKCGENFECKLRTDLKKVKEALCYCNMQETVCGDDGNTYDNMCQLMASAIKQNKKIKEVKEIKGRCEHAPIIVSAPTHQKNRTGEDVTLSCESKGRPIPTIEWTWTNVDGKTVFLPSDDFHISSNIRGGPEKWSVTSFLQIMDVEKHHEGDYTCVAQNEKGVSMESARVIVDDEEKQNKKGWKKGRKERKGRNNRNKSKKEDLKMNNKKNRKGKKGKGKSDNDL